MVLCKFFLQGTCKFGDYCRFQHQVPPNTFNTFNDQSSASILRQSNFNGTPQSTVSATKVQNTDANTLLKSVTTDMLNAEKGGQWLLSCYGPLKEKPCFPGFSDQSFEEVRFGFLDAQKNGTIEQYKQQLNVMLQDAIMKTKALQNPTPDLMNMLKNLYNTPNSGIENTGQPNVFAANNQPAPFGSTNQNIFANTTSKVFSGNNNVFGSTTQQTIFSKPAPNTQSNIFAQNTSNTGLFAQANQALNTGNSSFAIQSNQTMFGRTQPAFSQQNSTSNSMFRGVQSNTSASSIFGSTPQASVAQPMFSSNQQGQTPIQNVFGNPLAPSHPFAAPMNTGQPAFAPAVQQNQTMDLPFTGTQQIQASQNMFTTTPQQPMNDASMSIMNSTPTTIPQNIPVATQQPSAFQHSANIFGVPQSQNSVQPMAQTNNTTQLQNQGLSNIFRSNTLQAPKIDNSLYSKLEDLNDMEIKWFESDELDMFNIPEKPPTYEMCYKT